MPTFRVAVWATEYKRAYIEASTPQDAEKIALDSLWEHREDLDWQTFESDYGVGDVEELQEA